MSNRPRVVVIGGGISGLSSAFNILSERPETELVVLEAGPRAGGVMGTAIEDGFVLEGGPVGFLNRNDSTRRLAKGLGIQDDVVFGSEENRSRYIFSKGRLHRFPSGASSLLTTTLLTRTALARLLLEPAMAHRSSGQDESVAEYARRRLGREAAELLVEPVVSGIYSGDVNRLSLKATLPELAQLELRGQSLLKRLWRARSEQAWSPTKTPRARRSFTSFRWGFGQLLNGLSTRLREQIICHSPVDRVVPTAHGFTVEVGGAQPRRLQADAVISAAPATSAQRFLTGIAPALSELLISIKHTPAMVVNLAYRELDVPHALDAYGYLVPSRERRLTTGVLFVSSIYPGLRAPPGRVLLNAVLNPSHTELDWSDERITAEVRRELGQSLGILEAPLVSRVVRHRTGLPQYGVDHMKRLDRAESALKDHPGLWITGNAFRGVGLNACTQDAEATAKAVVTYLDQSESVMKPLKAVH